MRVEQAVSQGAAFVADAKVAVPQPGRVTITVDALVSVRRSIVEAETCTRLDLKLAWH